MSWKASIKRMIPPTLLKNVLLGFPFLYRLSFIRYEANLSEMVIEELLQQLQSVQHLEGNIAECGSSRCGGSILMANSLHSAGIRKIVYAFDSFEGFDPSELEAERKLGFTSTPDNAFTSTSYEYVTAKIKKLGLSESVIPVKGFFQDILPQFDSNLCFAFIDCDLKDSIFYCAQTLWPKLVSGGRMVFHDYAAEDFKGAKLGVDEFVQSYSNQFADHGFQNDLYYIHKQ
jgi:O-methyltransferase